MGKFAAFQMLRRRNNEFEVRKAIDKTKKSAPAERVD